MRVRTIVIGGAVLVLGGCARARSEPAEAPSQASVAPAVEPAAPAPPPEDEPAPDSEASSDGEAPAPDPSVADAIGAPTEAEFQAWDRKDPEGEKHLYKWDRENLGRLLGYVDDLRCFRQEMVAAGERHLGQDDDAQWTESKRRLITALDAWLQQLFVREARIFEKSKLVGNLLEAHELVSMGYPRAYDEGDPSEIDRSHAHWKIVEQKMRTYIERLGGILPEQPERCRKPTGG